MRALLSAIAVFAATALTACGERTQTLDTGARQDTHASQGTGMPFAVPGWKQGDKASWEQQLKTRAQNGQNDYTKVN